MSLRLVHLTLALLVALVPPAAAQDREVVATTLAVGTSTSPTGSSVKLDGLATAGATEVLLRDATTKEIAARVLGKGDLPATVGYTDEAETWALLQTFTSGFTSNGAGQINSTLGVTGLATFGNDITVNGGDILSTASTLRMNAGGTGQIYLQDATRMDGVDLSALGWASWTTGWGVSAAGSADFRHLQADELHVRLFIAELQEAHNGAEAWVKSTAVLHSAFTCPASSGGTVSIRVRDFPSAANMRVFSSGDWVLFRVMSRTDADNDGATDLTVGECAGTVSAYADGTSGNEGTQSWTFTRGTVGTTGGNHSGSVPAEQLALSFGVSGSGFLEATVNDGAEGINGPYFQSVKWTSSPASAAGTKVVTSRMGKLTGITGVADEFGFIGGTYAATNGQYVKASNAGVDLHGVDLTLWEGTAEAIRLRRNSGSPYISIGDPAPSSFSSGAGIWFGIDSGAAKGRLGDPSAAHLSYDPSDGVRMMDGATVRGQWFPGGQFRLNDPAGTPRVTLDAAYFRLGSDNVGQANLYVDTSTGVSTWRIGTNHRVYVEPNSVRMYDPGGTRRVWVGDLTGSGATQTGYGFVFGDSATANQSFIQYGDDTGDLDFCVAGVGCLLNFDGVTGTITSAGSLLLNGTATIGSGVTVGTSGWLRSGQTAYATGTGYWLEYNGGTPRVSIGGSSKYLRWTGSELQVQTDGLQISDAGIVTNEVEIDHTGVHIGTSTSAFTIDGHAIFYDAGNNRWELGAALSAGSIIATGGVTTSGDIGSNSNFAFFMNGQTGQSQTVTVRDSAGTGTCTLVFTGGIKTGGTC